jgi:hypothetical protein
MFASRAARMIRAQDVCVPALYSVYGKAYILELYVESYINEIYGLSYLQ